MTKPTHNFEPFNSAFAHMIWDTKYRLRTLEGTPLEDRIEESWHRVARAVAKVEKPENRQEWEDHFYNAMSDFAFLPAGRILAGAGTGRRLTLFNCFVMGNVKDDLSGIFESVKESALTMQQGGGIGVDFSTLRPRNSSVTSIGATASGPVSFMDVWNGMCGTIMAAGGRRGAMMGTLRCDHPDIEEFINVKSDPLRLRNFNLSVLVTDAFMHAVKNDLSFELKFGKQVKKTINARTLWHKLMKATYDYAEPGVIFIDRVNALNPLSYCENIFTTNPCGEQPLPPYGACLLGSINLAKLVEQPFTTHASLDINRLKSLVKTAIRFLDNAIDISPYPLRAQENEAKQKRRIGLGVTGLANALIMCGYKYDSSEAITISREWIKTLREVSITSSINLAKEKGSFPLFNKKEYLSTVNAQKLPQYIRDKINNYGIRNGLQTTIAPTGTISLLAGNVSSGIEPIFDISFQRRMRMPDGSWSKEKMEDFSYQIFHQTTDKNENSETAFVTAQTLKPSAHLKMQAALQPFIDSAISKTINCPKDLNFRDFKGIYEDAFDFGLKGCTTYRPNDVTGEILHSVEQTKTADKDKSNSTERNNKRSAPETEVESEGEKSDVVYLSQPLDRDAVLSGRTYKLKWPESDHALYITINDTIEKGVHRPFEIFINTKSLEHYAWVVALTRMISAIFRRGGDVSFVIKELQAIFDPKGGMWIEGKYVPSLIAAIGNIIEQHMIETGCISRENLKKFTEVSSLGSKTKTINAKYASMNTTQKNEEELCYKCLQPTLVFRDGCHTCMSCGYSKCS